MSFNNLLDLYDLGGSSVLFKHVESNELLALADNIEKYRLEIQNKYDNDEHLLEVLDLLKKVFFNLASSFLSYNKIVNKEYEEHILTKLVQIKKSYPELFNKVVKSIAKSLQQLIEGTSNNLRDYLCEYININAKLGMKISIVTKRAISNEERRFIDNNIKTKLKISYFTENGFRKSVETFDEVIYMGNPNYFGEYVNNTFKARSIIFISYDIFLNSMIKKDVFGDIDKSRIYSTIYEKVTIGDALARKSNINLDQRDILSIEVSKIIDEQKGVEGNSHDTVEACIVYLENDRILFAPRDSKIRVFIPQEKNDFIKQMNFVEVEEDDYIVIRNDRDTKLIADVADQEILKSNTDVYRGLQREWKQRLRTNVKNKSVKRVSEILIKKYEINTASLASVRSWCNEESICPRELPKILKALKYEKNKAEEIYETMKKIQLAHRKAGKIISDKLMSELSKDILNDLKEKGFYTFESIEFNGASFNIERIVSIDRKKHLIAPHNLMKPISID